MNNFFELEKRCKRYHKKRYIKFFIIPIILLLILLALAYYTLNITTATNKIEKKIEYNKTKIIDKNITYNEKIIKKELNKTIEQNITKDQISLEKEDKIPVLAPKINLDMIDTKKIETNKKTIEKKEEKEKTKPKKEDSKIVISTQELPSFDTSFKLMNVYFEDGDYEKSKEWAVKASKMQPQNEDIWKVYALSLYKLNKKDKAIKVLKTYLKYRKSTKIENILKSIEGGN
jgi:tetratricopeptide (TPR) repeat protein